MTQSHPTPHPSQGNTTPSLTDSPCTAILHLPPASNLLTYPTILLHSPSNAQLHSNLAPSFLPTQELWSPPCSHRPHPATAPPCRPLAASLGACRSCCWRGTSAPTSTRSTRVSQTCSCTVNKGHSGHTESLALEYHR